jgi:hypothetical protein
MRAQIHSVLCLAIFAVCPACATDPVPADKSDPLPTFLTAPSKSPATDADKAPSLSDPLPRTTVPPSLLPDDIPIGTKRPAVAKPPAEAKPRTVPKLQDTAEDLALRIRYRKARNAAEANEQVRVAWEDSRNAKTDHTKRLILKRYYDLLFARMLTTDRGIAPLVEKQRKADTAMLTQTRIAPTVPTE